MALEQMVTQAFPSPNAAPWEQLSVRQPANHVSTWEGIDQQHHRVGEVYVDQLRMDDDRLYEVHIGEPVERQTDVPVLKTTAWTTGMEGHNKHQMLKLMELGYPVVMVSPEGYVPEDKSIAVHWKLGREITLGYSAHNMLEIFDHIKGAHLYDTQQLALYGESRGAMIALCALRAAQQDSRFDIVHVEAVAPCFAEKFSKRDVAHFIWQVLQEPALLASDACELVNHGLQHYGKTVPLSSGRGFFVQAAALAPALFSGEAGHNARQLRHEATPPINLTLYNRDYSSQEKHWREIFADNPGTHIEVRRGGHLSIPRSLERTTGHFRQLLGTLACSGPEAA